ncbi:tetratricopeptide repeat protein [Flavilitoribacter nigricans]|nr:tetratricopeptide repeat protein [Flavilitoribacter nigricans]
MRRSGLFILCLFFSLPFFAQSINQQTSGDQSPAVVAENIRITYGVPPNITLEIIKVYERAGSSPTQRNAAVRELIKKYKALGNKGGELNKAQRANLGLPANSPLVSILNYDLFLSTKGNQSPAIYAPGGYAEIWYGIPPEAFKGIWNLLEDKQLALEDFEKRFQEQIEKYRQLEGELAARADYDKIAARAKEQLERGDFAGAERILEEDVLRHNKESAYRNYQVGTVKELNLKPREATEFFMLAALLDKQNPEYTLAYGQNLLQLGDYKNAAGQFELSLGNLPAEQSQGEAAARRYNQLGDTYRSLGQYDQAIYYHEQALNILLGLDQESEFRIANNYNNLGLAYVGKGEINRGIDYYQQALEIYQKNPEAFYPQIAIGYNNLGSAYSYRQDFPQALEYYEFALKVLQDIFGEDHPAVATSYNNIGFVYGNMQQLERSLEYFERALNILQNIYGELHPNFARTYGNLGVAYAYKGDTDLALEYYRKVLDIDLRIFPDGHPDIADDHTNIGQAYLDKKDFPAAIDHFQQALAIDLQFNGPHHLRIARDQSNLGFAFLGQQSYERAVESYQQAIEVYKQLTQGDPQKLVTIFNNLGAAYAKLRNFPKAIEALENAKSLVSEFFPAGHPYLQQFNRDIQYLRDQMK